MNKPLRLLILAMVALAVIIVVSATDAGSRSTVTQLLTLAGIGVLVWRAEKFWNTGRIK